MVDQSRELLVGIRSPEVIIETKEEDDCCGDKEAENLGRRQPDSSEELFLREGE